MVLEVIIGEILCFFFGRRRGLTFGAWVSVFPVSTRVIETVSLLNFSCRAFFPPDGVGMRGSAYL